MYVTDAIVRTWEAVYGQPEVLSTRREISPPELAMVRGSRKFERSHDITFCISDGARLAVIAKSTFPPGAYRIPSGGLSPGEPLEIGVMREAREETGLTVRCEHYLLRVHAEFTCGDQIEPWVSHVIWTTTAQRELAPTDHHEIREARWATLAEIQGPIRAALVASGRALLGGYRVDLTDALVRIVLARGLIPPDTGPTPTAG